MTSQFYSYMSREMKMYVHINSRMSIAALFIIAKCGDKCPSVHESKRKLRSMHIMEYF